MKLLVKAGQVYQAPSGPKTQRLVVIEQVRSVEDQPYVLAHEILASGRKPRGADRNGIERGESFRIQLTHENGEIKMPGRYKLSIFSVRSP